MLAERRPAGSTGGTALVYPARMNARDIIIPALLLLVTDSAGCKDETPANTPGEFGDPCKESALVGTPDGCAEGLDCYQGYCEEICTEDTDCQPVDGWKHECVAGLCQIFCGDDDVCPQTLNTPLECHVVGSAHLCRAREGAS